MNKIKKALTLKKTPDGITKEKKEKRRWKNPRRGNKNSKLLQ
jgi:hypothetical protein